MPLIHLLDKNTINKIAAGEVVERPISVVKELTENAIDSGASAISIEIKEGGIKTIRITDNGCGIDASDIFNAFLRHSTSKISKIEDLLSVASLGFRGEALASIASISQVELITKTDESLTGVRCIIEDGMEKLREEIGCPNGTTMIISNMFYNVPARKKFLKSASTESSYISDLVNRLALSHPDISFKFINNGVVKLHTSGNNNLKDCVMNIYGKDVAKNLMTISYENDGIRLRGFIGKPSVSRGNRTYETYYINGRYVKSKVVQKAIEDAYKTKLTVHQYPFVVLDLMMQSSSVDVNVHPTKMEVRFDDEKIVYNFIYQAVTTTLNQSELIHEVSFDKIKRQSAVSIKKDLPEPFEKRRMEMELVQDQAQGSIESKTIDLNNAKQFKYNKNIDKGNGDEYLNEIREKNVSILVQDNTIDTVTNISRKDDDEGVELNKHLIIVEDVEDNNVNQHNKNSKQAQQLDFKEKLFTDIKNVKNHKIVGQLFDTYWIIELLDKYYIIDQHAAHERVLYDKIINGLDQQVGYKQQMLYPTVVNLSMQEMAIYNQYQELFNKIGFEVEAFGPDSLVIRAVPFIFDKTINDKEFINILDQLLEEFRPDQYEVLLSRIASMACKAAVKANDKMSVIEYKALIDDLLALDNPFNCPHGRPTIISMTKYELEKKFKRIM